MKRHWKSRVVIALAALHLALLMAYSFPDRIVPEKLRMIAQLYVRPLFHQQWKLFAPDPPMCSCAIERSIDRVEWQPIETDHYLEDRIAQNLARHAQRALRSGNVDPLLIDALRKAARNETAQAVLFRLKEQCVIDPQHPADRELRFTPIGP